MKNKITSSITIIISILIIGIIGSNVIWLNSYINSFTKYIGAASDYLSNEEIISLTNHMIDGNRELYIKGSFALADSGYKNSYVILLIEKLPLSIYIALGVLVVLVIGCIFYYNIGRKKYMSQARKLVAQALDDREEMGTFSLIPQEITDCIYKLKYKIKRLTELHEEDDTRLLGHLEDISHQLKSPLSVIRVVCEKMLINHRDIDSSMNKCLVQIDKMAELIKHLLLLGKFQCGKIVAQFKEILPEVMLETLANDFEMLLQEQNVSLEIIGETGGKWLCDEFWLRQALDNIVMNSIRHVKDGGKISIEYSSGTIENEIIIRDDGGGFEFGTDNVFDRFNSKDRTGKEGSGLGLAIAKQAVELHMGTISVKNHLPSGAEFRISFPRTDSKALYEKR